MLARLWTNGLRSNVTPLELCKLDIVSIKAFSEMNHTHRDLTTLIGKNLSLHQQEVLQLCRERSLHPSMPISTKLP
jgi:hypothetical protein